MEQKFNKKIILIIIGTLLLLIGLIFTLINVLDKEKNNENIYDNNISNEETINDNEDSIKKAKIIYIVEGESQFSLVRSNDNKTIIKSDDLTEEDIILGKYECTSDNCYECYSRQPISKHFFVGNDKVLLCDGKSTEYMSEWILYNYNTNEIENKFVDVTYSYNISKDDFVIIVRNNTDYALMNKKGDFITQFIYDSFPYSKIGKLENEKYYYEKNYVVARKNNLKGILDVTNGETVVDFKYNDIMFSYNGMYSIMENNKWYLMDQSENKIFSTGYDYIAAFDFGILVMQENEDNKYQVKIIDYEGKDITNTIEYFSEFVGGYNQEITRDDNIITINLQHYFSNNIFEYNILEQKLEYINEN